MRPAVNVKKREKRTLAAIEVRHERHAPGGQNPPKHVRPMEGSGVIALQDSAFLLVGEDLLSHVVDHHGTFEVGYGWIGAVLLPDECAP